MARYRRILVVPESANDTQPALGRATQLARAAGARLDLLACQYDEHLAGTRFGDSDEFRAAREAMTAATTRKLEALAAPLRDSGMDVHCHSVFAHPRHEAIIDAAERLGPDLVVKDTHYHAPLARTLFSNTDWELIRLCPHDMLLVKPDPWSAPLKIMAAVDPLHDADHEAALDRAILDRAIAVAGLMGGHVEVVHTYQVALQAAGGLGLPTPVDVEALTSQVRQRHVGVVGQLLDGYDVEAVHVREGGARRALVELAGEIQADIAVVGAVSRSGLRRRFIGHTARYMLERVPCDLMVVRPDFT